MTDCPECGRKFKQVSNHYSANPEHRPTFSKRQHEIITGILLGDGWVSRERTGNPRFAVDMIAQEFIEWLDTQFESHTLGARLQKTAEQSAKHSDNDSKNYHDVWRFKTRTSPELERYRDWYGEDGKRYPDSLKLTPTILKMWYVSDGSYHLPERNATPTLSFGCKKEMDRKEFVQNLFDPLGVDITWTGGLFRVDMGDAERVWNYMGSSPVGFEYKWPST